MSTVKIKCNDLIFEFAIDSEMVAWYDLDCMVVEKDGCILSINADREVYGIFTNQNGEKQYGTIGDMYNEVIADNYPCDENEVYIFVENPLTKDYYV